MQCLTSKQVNEWIAYDKLEPIGQDRIEYMLAQICSVIVNLAQNIHCKRGSTKPTKSVDFLPRWDRESVSEPVKKQTVAEMRAVMMQWVNRGKK